MTAPSPAAPVPVRRSGRALLATVALAATGLILVGTPSQAASGDITTVVGTGQGGYSGDGGPATAAKIAGPQQIVLDGAGNLYEGEQNGVVRKVDTAGIITTVAGNGTFGHSGDGGPATAAAMGSPAGIALGPGGIMYIADQSFNMIRKVDGSGTISTFAGGGSPADGIGDGGPATSAKFDGPGALLVDGAGNLLIADSYHNRIRRVDSSGNITTVAGGGSPATGNGDGGPATSAMFNSPQGLLLDPAGDLYISDQESLVRKVDTSGIVTTVAGTISPSAGIGDGGPATSASVSLPFFLAMDPAGNLFIADHGNHRVRKVDTSGIITTIAGGGSGALGDGGPATSATLNSPQGLALTSAGNLLVGDFGDNRIREITGVVTQPTTTTVAPTTTTVAPTTTTVAPTTTTTVPTTTTTVPPTTTTTVPPTTTTVPPTTTTVAPTTTTAVPPVTTTPLPPTTLAPPPFTPGPTMICQILQQFSSVFSFLGQLPGFGCGNLPSVTTTVAPTTTTVAPTTTTTAAPPVSVPPMPGLDRLCDIIGRLRQAFPFLHLNIQSCP